MLILAGDIGGTKTILRICDCTESNLETLFEQTFPSQKFNSFYGLLNEFLISAARGKHHISRICMAVAGPVLNGHAKITNLPWTIDEQTIKEDFNIERVSLVNDFMAVGHGLSMLVDKDVCTLQQGTPDPNGVKTILGAGTGLGMCIVLPEDNNSLVLPSEAGCSSFSPRDLFEAELVKYLLKIKEQVVCEDIVSGAGLHNIYNFLRDTKNLPENATVEDAFKNKDPAEVISTHGMNKTDILCEKALDYFVRIYAEQASNFALITMATGGLYIAGGIAPKVIEKLMARQFTESFMNNKKMRHVLKNVPLYIIRNPNAGLLGAVRIASQMQ